MASHKSVASSHLGLTDYTILLQGICAGNEDWQQKYKYPGGVKVLLFIGVRCCSGRAVLALDKGARSGAGELSASVGRRAVKSPVHDAEGYIT